MPILFNNLRSLRQAKGLIEVMTHVHGKIYNYYKSYQTLWKQERAVNLIINQCYRYSVLKTDRSGAKVGSLIFF